MAALFALVGLLIFAQFRSESTLRSTSVGTSTSDRAGLIAGLVDANLRLRDEVSALQAKLADLGQQGDSLPTLVHELNQLKLVNGLLEVTGPGVVIVLDGALSAVELQDLVNELKNAGAEAIALNGHRLIARSVIISTGAGISIDATPISRPFVLQALGDADTILTAMTRKGGLLVSLQAAHSALQAQADEMEELTIPIFSRELGFTHAQVATSAP
jgi:uncharacterized protein YlxW (UPF0749 family)